MSDDWVVEDGDKLASGLSRVNELVDAGKYADAQSQCQGLLHDNPTSAALHETMGDILARRELWDEAAEWYELARQLHDSLELAKKYHDAVRRDRSARMGGADEFEDEEIATRRRGTRLLLLGVAAAVVSVVAIILIVGWLRTRDLQSDPNSITFAMDQPTTTRGTGLRSLSGNRGPRGMVTSPRAPGGSAAPFAHELPDLHYGAVTGQLAPRVQPRGTSTRQEEITAPITDHDRKVIDATSSLTWGDDRPLTGRITAVVDEFQGYAVIRISIPPTVPRGNLSEEIVKMAYRVALTAVRSDEAILGLTIQVVRNRTSRASDGGLEVVWRANATRRKLEEHVHSADHASILLTQVFAGVRWSPTITEITPREYDDTALPGAGASRTAP